MSKIFAGILVMTKLQVKDGESEELVALLQRRGKINTDNGYGFKNQSFAGLCEATSYGKAEGNETPEQALEREMTEELGVEAVKTIFAAKPVILYKNTEKDGDKVYIWTCLADKNILKEIKLDISSAGIEILRKSDLPRVRFATFDQKGLTVKNADDIDIFEVPKEALEKAFAMF